MQKLICTVLFFTALTSRADAGVILSFSQASANIAVGESVDVDLILTQTSPPISGADIRTNGLFNVDVQLNLDSNFASVTAITPGSGFADPFFRSVPKIPLLSITAVDHANGVRAQLGSPTSITLATFTFTGISAGTTLATTIDSPFFTDFVFVTDPSPNADIDSQIFGAEQFAVTVSAVPEPSSIILFALGASICGCVGFRQRVQKVTCEQTAPLDRPVV
jgi:PEP-CTERM motif